MSDALEGLSADAQATLLLCARQKHGEAGPKPLSAAEFHRVAIWLQRDGRRPADLLMSHSPEAPPELDPQRLAGLLGRGLGIGLATERMLRFGIRVLARADAGYPAVLRSRLGQSAPPLLYVTGALPQPAVDRVCIVGARDATPDGLAFAASLGEACARVGATVVSGGARGVDGAAVAAAMEAGGTALIVPAEGLLSASRARETRRMIEAQRLTLLSPLDPEAGFTVGNAMGRNRYLYALSDVAIIADADLRGGTWEGAVENLRYGWVPAFVRMQGSTLPGNAMLVGNGVKPFPEPFDPAEAAWLARLRGLPAAADDWTAAAPIPGQADDPREAVFAAFCAAVTRVLKTQNLASKDIAAALGLHPGQAQLWLKAATEAGVVRVQRAKARKVLYGIAERRLI